VECRSTDLIDGGNTEQYVLSMTAACDERISFQSFLGGLVAPVVRQNLVIAEPVLLSTGPPDRIRTCLN